MPILFRGDSTLLDEQPGIKVFLRRIFLKWVYSHIDFALYVGQNNRDYFLQHGLSPNQLILAPHAVDNNRFAEPGEQYQQQARQQRLQLDIGTDDIVLLFAGKFEPKKNPFFLLDIAKRISNPKLKFLFVGNGSLEEKLKLAASGDERILFLDFCNQSVMPVIYRIADVLILPSVGPGETWGLAANEAMASGTAVMLSAKTGSAIDLVKEPENGIVFEVNDIEKCVAFINNLLNDAHTLSIMKAASIKRIQQFSYGQTVQAIEELVNRIEEKKV